MKDQGSKNKDDGTHDTPVKSTWEIVKEVFKDNPYYNSFEKPLMQNNNKDENRGNDIHNPPVATKTQDQLGDQTLNTIFESGYERANATFYSIVRNTDLPRLLSSIQSVEARFNHKYKYDWVIVYQKTLKTEAMQMISKLVSGKAIFYKIPTENFLIPEWVDRKRAAQARRKSITHRDPNGKSEYVRIKARFQSGFFQDMRVLADYKYYCKIDPDVEFQCDVNYDFLKYMEQNKLTYGFITAPRDSDFAVSTLWDHTRDLVDSDNSILARDNLLDFISDTGGESYNLCTMSTAFEIADLEFFRSDAYRKLFNYLDKESGWFYERWSDSDVHSLGVSLLLPKNKVKIFDDFGYSNAHDVSCPRDLNTRLEHFCYCNPTKDSLFTENSCARKFFSAQELQLPPGVTSSKVNNDKAADFAPPESDSKESDKNRETQQQQEQQQQQQQQQQESVQDEQSKENNNADQQPAQDEQQNNNPENNNDNNDNNAENSQQQQAQENAQDKKPDNDEEGSLYDKGEDVKKTETENEITDDEDDEGNSNKNAENLNEN
ncbi:hypothetical protein PACTADRAFT_31067 [Pachysolen tannophilus NRRL Y-2460]|uniref:Glycosyltransferase family 15 protein n=1 Tax=Pachysolen tannophilus NRRL Y-2460 TaxID=669874 RepID=A0A1E4U0V6_PACTA|nr:hypothetical protein PACTADRAFT_31067 [Pachysolen tannophilus NRRL Y-2460]